MVPRRAGAGHRRQLGTLQAGDLPPGAKVGDERPAVVQRQLDLGARAGAARQHDEDVGTEDVEVVAAAFVTVSVVRPCRFKV